MCPTVNGSSAVRSISNKYTGSARSKASSTLGCNSPTTPSRLPSNTTAACRLGCRLSSPPFSKTASTPSLPSKFPITPLASKKSSAPSPLRQVFSRRGPLIKPHTTSRSPGKPSVRGRNTFPCSKRRILPVSCRLLASKITSRLARRLGRRYSCSAVIGFTSLTGTGLMGWGSGSNFCNASSPTREKVITS
ncbi:hypothetical protein ES703_105658 [subsurface metagenome]